MRFLGLDFDRLTLNEAVCWIEGAAELPFSYVVTPNVDHVVRLHEKLSPHPNLYASYAGARLCLNDSRVLELLARLSGVKLGVVTGSDLTAQVLATISARLESVAIIGGDAEMIDRLEIRYPATTFVAHFPPPGVLRNREAQEEIVRFVSETRAPLTFFAIGSPQSELLCSEIARRGNCRGVGLCVGASLEFASGLKRRAPILWQRLRLEWLYRLLQEPRRLAYRYLIEDIRIVPIWLTDRAHRR